MNCRETQKRLAFHHDDELAGAERVEVESHLRQCPLCRDESERLLAMVEDLGRLRRDEAPAGLEAAINYAIGVEASLAASGDARVPAWVELRDWMRPRLMPYTVGLFASLLLFMAVSMAIIPQLKSLAESERALRIEEASIAQLSDGGLYNLSFPPHTRMYASRRTTYSAESPSINPSGAFAALETSPAPYGDDDGMIVVADVFINGNASLADVVQAPRDPRMLDDLQEAFRRSPAFVPAVMDRRPKTMRVVLTIQKVAVREESF